MVRRRHDERVHAEEVEGCADRGVRLLADRTAQVSRVGTRPGATTVVASHGERGEVAERAARDERPARALRHPGAVGQERQQLVLGHHHAGGLEVARAVERRARDDHVEQQGGLRGGVRDEGEEPRVVDRHDGRGQVVSEQLEDLLGVVALLVEEALDARGGVIADPTEVERWRIDGQALAAVLEDGVRHRGVVGEHRVTHVARLLLVGRYRSRSRSRSVRSPHACHV